MKPDFKVDFTKRDVVKTVCLTIVLLLVLVLGNTFGYVEAGINYTDQPELSSFSLGTGWGDLYSSPLNISDYTNSSIYDSDAHIDFINFNGNLTTPNAFSLRDSINLPVQSSTYWYDQLFDVDYSYYSCYAVTDNFIYLFPSGSVICGPWVYCPSDNFDNTSTRYIGFRYSLDGGFHYLGTEAWFFDEPNTHVVGDYHYHDMGTPFNIVFSNMPMYIVKSQYTSDTATDFVNYLGGGNDHFTPINYMLYDGNYDDGSGGGSGETSENNLYLQDSKWSFSIPKWSNLTAYSGNATFSASLNEFQQENLSDFYLRFTFTIHTSQSYVNDPGVSGGGHDTANVSQSSSGATGYVSGIYKYKDSSTSNEYLDVTLQDFYNMGSSKAFMTLNGIFDRCYKVGFSGNMSDTTFINWYNTAVNSAEYTTTKATLYCYATLYDSNGNSSGNCTYYYDLLNGSTGVTDSSMSVNNNPFVDSDGNVSTTIPGTESTTENSYSGNGVNVTQTVTVNNDSGDSKSWLWTLITSLITSGSDNEDISEAGMSDTLINFTGINPWLSLMSTTLGFVPATVWTTLSACFIVVMGILVVAFVLRIILDLL